MDSNVTKSEVDPLTDWNGLYQEIQDESPRAAEIIAAAFLDAQLRNLISKALIDDSKIVDELLGTEKSLDRPLSSFSSRIRAAYCMGLISKNIYLDLELVKKIRNKFAHKMHGYNFDEPEIVDWCKSLRLAKQISDVLPRLPKTHQYLFLLGVTQLVSWIAVRTLEVEKIPRPAVDDRKKRRAAT
jgi:DNA-binding MltR family transcriptional regulator